MTRREFLFACSLLLLLPRGRACPRCSLRLPPGAPAADYFGRRGLTHACSNCGCLAFWYS